MRPAASHAMRAGLASAWNYVGRVLGLGWTLAVVHGLGIGSYGQYAVAVSIAAIVNAAVDNAFHVRSLRIDDDRYERERAGRVIVAAALGAIGSVCVTQWFVLGFAGMIAAGEMLFNTWKSRLLRRGRPDVAMRADAARQTSSILLGLVGLYAVPDSTLPVAGTLYALPYLVVAALCVRFVTGRRPALPERVPEFLLLTSEALAAAVYTQGDVVLVGWIAGETAAGYYSLAVVAALAISTIGQNYANTYLEKMRAAAGHHSSGPRFRDTLRAGALTGLSMAVVGAGLLAWGGADATGTIAVVLSVFVAARTVNFVLVTLLIVQRRDGLRVRATVTAAVVKSAVLLVVIGPLGGIGAAVVSTICELVLVFVYHRAVFGPRTPPHRLPQPERTYR